MPLKSKSGAAVSEMKIQPIPSNHKFVQHVSLIVATSISVNATEQYAFGMVGRACTTRFYYTCKNLAVSVYSSHLTYIAKLRAPW